MNEKMEPRKEKPGKKVSRRDFAKTSVAAGAAAVALPNTLRGDTVPARAATESAAAGATKTAYMRRKPVTGPPENPGYGGPRTLQPTVTTKGAPKEDPGGWVEGTTIPAEYYVDDMHFAADERFLADALWMMVDHESRIPNAGDYFTFEYGRSESILIVRDKAGKVNGYYNVCQHRGSRLCRHADHPAKEQESRISVRQLGKSGNTPVFRCPYHAWTYDLEGNLIYAYAMGDDFDPGEHGLKPCNLRVSEGHIFVNLSQGEPPDFEEATARFQALAKHYGMKDLKVAVREQYTMLGNWKLGLENFQECYHCGPSHTSLVTTHNWDHSLSPEQTKHRDEGVKAWVPPEARSRVGAAGGMGGMGQYDDDENFDGLLNKGFVTGSMDGKPVAPLLPAFNEWKHRSRIATTGWSTAYWQAYDDHVAVARFTPRDTKLTDVEIFWLVDPDAVEGKDYDPENVKALWHVTIQEDIWIVDNNHDGVLSAGYAAGPYSHREGGPSGFIKWYMTEVVGSGEGRV